MQNNCDQFYDILVDQQSSVESKYKAIFELRTLNNLQAVTRLQDAFRIMDKWDNKSCLLLHEIAYALGQLDLQFSDMLTPFLIEVINDNTEIDVVRHEAAEALANLNQPVAETIFEQYSKQNINDGDNILRDTCILGLAKMKSMHQLAHLYGTKYCGTREPAAPFEQLDADPILYILDENTPLFNKYRALYFIRDNPQQYFTQLDKLLLSDKLGALIKHEMCFIIGQIEQAPPAVMKALLTICDDKQCSAIVRHEALAALQTVSSDPKETRELLTKYIDSADQIVRETAMVSLDLMEFYVPNI